ncbi:sufE-like protein 1, chloroplastic/mitochondrial [Malania oleifera]|uniref:sufE-like protein 1, chloroplastic/mitochondrial n=1 Tax=Malania oleifera TaxID=397392 RepID=UPI0025ADE5E3|nr:sufE-like protein 1, chloroplastic/mitochondrial [Malania oleifera]
MSISSSFRLISLKIPYSLHCSNLPISKILISCTPPIPPKLSLFRSVSIQRLPTKRPSSSSSSLSSSSSYVSLQPIEELPPKLQDIVKLFQAVQEPKAKYEQLLFYGKTLAPLDTQFKTTENKVQGCVSQVWVRAYLDEEKNVRYEADSDSVLTKGLAALLVQGLSGRPVEEIVRVSPDFVVLLGLQQSLTPSRNNGFLNMLKLMQKKALQLYVDAEKVADLVGEGGEKNTIASSNLVSGGGDLSSGVSSNSSSNFSIGGGDLRNRASLERGSYSSSKPGTKDLSLNSGMQLGKRGHRIKERLERELSPIELQVEDISYQHAGHAGVRGSEGETHFNLKVVSEEFEGKSLVKRHRMVYNLLQEELQCGLHALSIVAKTPSEVNGG